VLLLRERVHCMGRPDSLVGGLPRSPTRPATYFKNWRRLPVMESYARVFLDSYPLVKRRGCVFLTHKACRILEGHLTDRVLFWIQLSRNYEQSSVGRDYH